MILLSNTICPESWEKMNISGIEVLVFSTPKLQGKLDQEKIVTKSGSNFLCNSIKKK